MTGVAAALTAAVSATSRLIDSTYPPNLCVEAADRRRLDKLGEEFGEVMQAYGGMVGENPRKGVTHVHSDVLDELLDVAACALGAFVHMTSSPYVESGDPVELLLAHVERKHARLVAAIEAR